MGAIATAFAYPVLHSQRVFRTVMDAMARPGLPRRLEFDLSPPAPLGHGAAAVALTLLDFETPIWIDEHLSGSPDVSRWIQFHTGAPRAAAYGNAAFAFFSHGATLPTLSDFATGTAEYPDRSTTIIAEIASFEIGAPLRLTGPGIDGARSFAPASLPDDFILQWRDNHALFPCGVDLLLVAGDWIAALPRSTRIEAGS